VRVEGTAEVLFKGDVTKASEIRRYEKKEELGTCEGFATVAFVVAQVELVGKRACFRLSRSASEVSGLSLNM
jgi:hypothetical protein